MKAQLELAPLDRAVEQVEMPKAETTVKAGSLLEPAERVEAERRGWLFGVEVDGKTYLATAQQQVPRQATIPRTHTGSLVGVAAVTGG